MDDQVAPAIAGYRLERILGEGGMGQVWRAHRESDGRLVALKLVRAALLGKPGSRVSARFFREIAVCKTFAHPNLVKILDGGASEDGQPFLAMEYVDGRSLSDLVGEALVPEARLREVARQVVEAFRYFHPRGLVHRDVKPANVMLERGSGRVVLLDFGLAHVDEATALTGTGSLLGTPCFMPPEQFVGGAVDARTDLFALGATLYLCAAGDLPYRLEELALAGGGGAPRFVPEPKPPAGLSAGFSAVILRCLALDPARRYQDAEGLAAALAALDGEGAVPDATLRAPSLLARRPGRGRVWPLLAAGLAVGALALAALHGGLGPAAPRGEGRSDELDRLRGRVAAAPGGPSSVECAALGAAAARRDVLGRLGVLGQPEPAAAGLYYLARWARRADRSAAASSSLRWYELLFERHGPAAVRTAAGTALGEYVEAASAAEAEDRCAAVLGRLGLAAGPSEVGRYYAFWQATALASLAARTDAPGALRPPPAAALALEALEPLLRRLEAGDASRVLGLVPPSELFLLADRLHRLVGLPASRDAWVVRLRRLAAVPGCFPEAERGPLLLEAAGGLVTDLRGTNVYRPADLAAAADLAREALRSGRTSGERALARLALGEALCKAGLNAEGVAELQQVASADLPRERRFALHWTLGCALDLLFRPADAARSFAAARAVAPTPAKVAEAEERVALARAAMALQGR